MSADARTAALPSSEPRPRGVPSRPRLALVLLVLLQVAVAALLLDALGRYKGWSPVVGEDTDGYVLVARHLAGEPVPAADVALLRYRLFNPLVPALAALLAPAVGLLPAFVALNVLSWIAAGLLFHALLRRTDDDAVAWAGAAILVTSLPFVEWGLPVMLDAAAYALAAGGVLAAVAWRGRDGWAPAAGLALLSAAAVLVKPTLLALPAFFFLLALRDGVAPQRRAEWTKAAAVALGGGGLTLAVYAALGLHAADFLTFGTPRHRGLVYLASAAFFCFHWGWLVALDRWRRRDGAGRPGLRPHEAIYGVAFVPLYLLFIHSPRLFFLAFPAVLPAVARGLAGLAARRRVPAWLPVAAYAVTSNLLAALHLFVMRGLAIRSWETLLQRLTG